MVGHLDRRKSTSACLFTFAKRVISWQSKIIQKFVALSTNTKPEFNMVTKVAQEMFWMKMFVSESGLNEIFCWQRDALDEKVCFRIEFESNIL